MYTASFKTRQQNGTWSDLLRFWEQADESNRFASGWVFDHMLPILGAPPGPVLESWTLLSALAMRTRNIGLGVMVSGNGYRNPALLAKIATTLDVISSGRAWLGIGAGWNEREHRAFGFPLAPVAERMDRLDEACQVIDALFDSPTGATFHGQHHAVRGAILDPPPVRGRIPIMVGGRGERRTLRAAARWADAWNLPAGTPEELEHKIGVLRNHCVEWGRDTAAVAISVQVTVTNPEEALVVAMRHSAAGADNIVFVFDAPYNLGHLDQVIAGIPTHDSRQSLQSPQRSNRS